MPFDAPPPHPAEAEAAPKAAAGGVLARAKALVRKQLHIVGRLAELGISRARAMMGEWETPTKPPPKTADEAREGLNLLAYTSAKVNRAVRLAVLLRERLICDLRKLRKGSLVDARRVLDDKPVTGLSEQVTRNLQLDCVLQDLMACADQLARSPAAKTAPEAAAEPAERAPIDPLRRYVRSLPVSVLIDEICNDLDLPYDTPRLMAERWESQQDHPPTGEVPREARGRGPKGRVHSPPSSASSTLRAKGDDPSPADPPWIARERGAFAASPTG